MTNREWIRPHDDEESGSFRLSYSPASDLLLDGNFTLITEEPGDGETNVVFFTKSDALSLANWLFDMLEKHDG